MLKSTSTQLLITLIFALSFFSACTKENNIKQANSSKTLQFKTAAIVGGGLQSGYPAIGALTVSSDDGYHGIFCTATLIHKKWLLTAAHCAEVINNDNLGDGESSFNINQVEFAVGSDLHPVNETKKPTTDAQFFAIKRAHVHPTYSAAYIGMDGSSDDIALIELDVAIPSSVATPMQLNFAPLDEDFVDRSILYVGYGVNTAVGTGVSSKKRSVKLPISEIFEEWYGTYSDSASVCYGDSGGPAIWKNEAGVLSVIGVNSRVAYLDDIVSICGNGSAQVRVDAYLGWITSIMRGETPALNSVRSCGELIICLSACNASSDDIESCQQTCASADPNPQDFEKFDAFINCTEECLSECEGQECSDDEYYACQWETCEPEAIACMNYRSCSFGITQCDSAFTCTETSAGNQCVYSGGRYLGASCNRMSECGDRLRCALANENAEETTCVRACSEDSHCLGGTCNLETFSCFGDVSPTAELNSQINEIFYDAKSSDAGKTFIELAGAPGLPLEGHRLVAYNGSNLQKYKTLTLTGSIANNGLFVIVDNSPQQLLADIADMQSAFADLQNGPDALAWFDAEGNLIDSLAYGQLSDTLVDGTVIITQAEDVPAGKSIQRIDATTAEAGRPTPGFGRYIESLPFPRADAASEATFYQYCGRAKECDLLGDLDTDACFVSTSYAYQQIEALGCGEEISALYRCLADSDSCEEPDCLEEQDAANTCIGLAGVEDEAPCCGPDNSCGWQNDDWCDCDGQFNWDNADCGLD